MYLKKKRVLIHVVDRELSFFDAQLTEIKMSPYADICKIWQEM